MQFADATSGQQPNQSVDELVDALSSEDAEIRRQAAYQLGELGEKAAAAVETLAKASDERSQEVRWYAVEALGKIGPAAKSAVPMILAGFKDEANDRFFRRSAIRSLGQIGEATEDVQEAVAQAYTSDDLVLRVEAAAAEFLLKSGEDTQGKFKTLLEAQDVEAKRAACWHLGNSLAGQLPDLNDALCDLAIANDETVAAAARWALSQRGIAAGKALLEKTDTEDAKAQLAYVQIIGQWLTAMKSKGDKDPEVKRALLNFLELDLVLNHLTLANNKSLQPVLASNLAIPELASVGQLTSDFPDSNPVERAFTSSVLSRIAETDISKQPIEDQTEAAEAVHVWITHFDLDEIPPPVWKLAAKLPIEPLPADILQQGVGSQNAVVRRYAAEILRRQQAAGSK